MKQKSDCQELSVKLSPPRRGSRLSSFQVERRGSANLQLQHVIRAVENKTLMLLRAHLTDDDSVVNGHGGMFHVTPLHCAVEIGWVEGVQELLQFGASVCSRNQYDQTPLHYAAAAKQQRITSMLLDDPSSSKAINLQDMRGTSPLHEGAACGSIAVVKLLLKNGALVNTKDKQGETPMHKAAKAGAFDVLVALMQQGADLREKDSRGISALRWLLLTIPDGLQTLLDHLLITNTPGSRKSPVTFDFSALVGDSGSQQCQLLSHFVNSDNREILAHPVCHVFLLIKWRRARHVFLGFLLFFVVYATLTSIYLFDRLLWDECQFGNEGDHLNNSTNSSAMPLSSCDEKKISHFLHPWMEVCICVQIVMLYGSQINRIRLQGTDYMKLPGFWLQVISVSCVLSLLSSSWYLGPDKIAVWEQHVATLTFLLLQVQFLLILRKYPSHGLYVAMFIRVAEDFLRIFFVYCTLLLCFTLTLFLAFNTSPHEDPVYQSVKLLFLKCLTMMVGSVDINKHTAVHMDRLPYTSHLTFLLFILLISIVLANLLVALAVSDIRELRSTAHLMRLASMVEAIVNIEQLSDFPLLRHLAGYCRLDTQVTQVRLWPQHDVREPSVVVAIRDIYSYSSASWWACITWLKSGKNSGRYEVRIPLKLQENILNRIASRNYDNKADANQSESDQNSKALYLEIIRRLNAIENSINR